MYLRKGLVRIILSGYKLLSDLKLAHLCREYGIGSQNDRHIWPGVLGDDVLSKTPTTAPGLGSNSLAKPQRHSFSLYVSIFLPPRGGGFVWLVVCAHWAEGIITYHFSSEISIWNGMRGPPQPVWGRPSYHVVDQQPILRLVASCRFDPKAHPNFLPILTAFVEANTTTCDKIEAYRDAPGAWSRHKRR